MELDTFLHKVQGILKNEQKIIGPLYTLKKENEEDISKVVGALKRTIANEDFERKIQLKLYILLFLNTDIDLYNDLKKNRKYAHLVGFFPKISQDLFIKLVFGLQLKHCLYESVQHFSSCLSYRVLDMCIKSLNWLDLFETVSFVEHLLISLFSKLINLEVGDKYNTHLKDVFQRLLLHYDAEKGGSEKRMRSWKSSKLKHYAGQIMASLLQLVEESTKIYCKKETSKLIDDFGVYNIQIDKESVEVKPISGLENSFITVQQCYEHIVARCHQNVCDVTIDIWLFWVEIDLDEIPDTENTLQRHVGEKAYTCREMLEEAECLGVSSKESSDLIARLKNIALKPNTEDDEASSFNLEKILENIQNPEKDSGKWLKFLINNPSFALDPTALEVLREHTLSLQSDDVIKLARIIFGHVNSNKDSAIHKSFIFEIVKNWDVETQIEISKCFVETCGLTEILKQDEFQPNFVETFNKVINEEDKEKELYPHFLSLALQNANAVVRKAVAEGITSEVRGHLMADILGKLQTFCDASLPDGNPLLVEALDELLISMPDMPENQRINYPLFVRELVMRKNLNGEKFIKTCLMVKMHHLLKTTNCVTMSACLETLSELLDIDCTLNYPATLIMLLQVVETYRWNPTSFTMAAASVCELALQLIPQFVTKWFDIEVDGKHLKNLSDIVHKHINPLNRYHLYRVLTEEPIPSEPAMQLIHRTHYGIGEWSVLQVTSDERLKLVYGLCFVLPVLTASEWQELFCVAAPKCSEFLSLFHIVSDSLILCLDSAKINHNEAVDNCLNYAVLNVAQVIKYELNRWTKDDNEYRISVLSKICQLVSNLSPSHQETSSLLLVKVLQQLLPEGSRRKPLTAEEMNSVTASIGSIKSTDVRQNLSREFLEMVHR